MNTYNECVCVCVCVFQEELSDMGDVRQLVNKLYMALNVDQHQIMKERDILAQIEDLKNQLAPLERVYQWRIIIIVL